MSLPVVRLCELFDITSSKRVHQKDWKTNGIPFYRAREIVCLAKDGTVENDLFIDESLYEEFQRKTGVPQAGDILISAVGTLGRSYIVKGGDKFYFKDASVIWLKKKVEVDSSYIWHALNSEDVQRFIQNSSGATVGTYTIARANETEIPLPPLVEQKRIAAILDKADAIRRKRQQAIQLADDFLRAVFLEMFGDPNTNPKRIKVCAMTDIFEIKTGSLNSNAAVLGGKYPFFTCAKDVFAIDTYAFDQEALLLAGNNAQADYDVKHYIGKFNAYQRTYVLTLKDIYSSYPFYKFALEYQLANLKRVSKGSNTKYITMEIMSRTMLPVPSEKEQDDFVQFFAKIKKINSSFYSQYAEENNMFSSLSQKAFSGQL